jgi:hypothetical protein
MTGPRDAVARGVAFTRDHTFAARRRRGPELPGADRLPWRSGGGGAGSDPDGDGAGGERDLPRAAGHALLAVSPFAVSYLVAVAAYRALPFYAAVVAVSLSVLACVPFYVGGSRGRRDYAAFRRLDPSGGGPTPADAAAAFDRLDARQRATRRRAVRTIAPVCRDGPGAFLDELPVDAGTVATTLVYRLRVESGDPALRRELAAVAELLSRDYGGAFVRHGKRLRALLAAAEPAVQVQLTLVLGNVGATANGSPAGYAEALTPAVGSDDAAVRRAAAVALGRLDCERSRRYLRVLTGDDDADVRSRAERSVRALAG